MDRGPGGALAAQGNSGLRAETGHMLDAERIVFLESQEGAGLLSEAASAPEDVLSRLNLLRARYSAGQAASAVQLLDLRRRAAHRFAHAGAMFFTRDGLEQATSEAVARWRAGRYPDGARVADLCCGVGSDTVALGERGPVFAFDRDMAACCCARANARVNGVGGRVAVACADVTRLRLCADAALLDPTRRRGDRRVSDPGLYAPPLDFAHEVRAAIPDLCVKVSPGLPDSVLNAFGARIEFVSERGECKEAALWFGGIGPSAVRSASLLPSGISVAAEDAEPPPLSEPLDWLLEPDPAIVRAHLVAEVAQRAGARLLDPRIAYLTSGRDPGTPLTTAYRVIDWMPFGLRRLRERMRALDLRASVVKKRGVPMDPETIRHALPSQGCRDAVVVLTRLRDAPIALLCELPQESHRP